MNKTVTIFGMWAILFTSALAGAAQATSCVNQDVTLDQASLDLNQKVAFGIKAFQDCQGGPDGIQEALNLASMNTAKANLPNGLTCITNSPIQPSPAQMNKEDYARFVGQATGYLCGSDFGEAQTISILVSRKMREQGW